MMSPEKIEKIIARKNGNKFDYIAIIDDNEIMLRSKSARLYENAFVHAFSCGHGDGISGFVTYGKKHITTQSKHSK